MGYTAVDLGVSGEGRWVGTSSWGWGEPLDNSRRDISMVSTRANRFGVFFQELYIFVWPDYGEYQENEELSPKNLESIECPGALA